MGIFIPTANIKDSPIDWRPDGCEMPPFDVASFQSKINTIVGLSNGEPILKLEWGGTAYQLVHTEWTLGIPTRTEKHPKYKFLRVNPITDITEEIPIRRWIIAERTEPEQYRANDTFDIEFIDEYGQRKTQMVKPKDGFYTPRVIIGDHSNCPSNCSDRKMCYGDYKHPSDAELDWIRQGWHQINQTKRLDARKAITPEQASEISAKANKEASESAEQKEKEFVYEHAKDWFRTHGHNLSDGAVSKDKYMFINPKHRTE